MTLNCSTAFRQRILGNEAFNDIMGGGCIRVFSGPQPSNADQPEQGTLLGVVTLNGSPWAAGSPTNGITWTQIGAWMQPAGKLAMTPSAAGDAGWFRLVGNAFDGGQLSYAAPRIDGSIGTTASPGEMTWTDLEVQPGNLYPVASLIFAFPPLT